jgi:hypothetical protein
MLLQKAADPVESGGHEYVPVPVHASVQTVNPDPT